MLNKYTNQRERELLFSAIADSVIDASDEDILEEIKEQGLDPEKIAAGVDSIFQTAILAHKKAQLAAAKEKYIIKTHAAQNSKQLNISSFEKNLEILKKWVAAKTDAGMGDAVLQFKDYESMQPEDVTSAIQQLIQLGELDPEDF